MKKQISPVVTVIVILVVVIIAALVWNHFSAGGGGAADRSGGAFGFKVDPSKIKPEQLKVAREKAQEAKAKLLGQAKGRASEKADGE